MIIACPVIAAVAAGVVSLAMAPVYEAHVSLYVRPSQPIASIDPTVGGVTNDAVLRTYAEWMTQPPILDQVNNELGLGLTTDALASKIKVTPQSNTLFLNVAV